MKRRDIVLNFSVCPSVCLSHPWKGPLRHVCGHTNHRTTMVNTFLKSPSDHRIRFSIFENISPELASKSTLYCYVMLTKGSIALRLRANYSTICTFLESPTDLDVHRKKRFALSAKIVEIDVAEVGTQNNETCSMWPGQPRFESC